MSSLHRLMPLELLFNLESMISLSIRISSRICLLLTKPFWKEETIFPIIFFSLFARTLTNNLYKLLTKLISLKSFRSFVLIFFGIKTKKGNIQTSFKKPLVKEFLKETQHLTFNKVLTKMLKSHSKLVKTLELYSHSKLIQ